MRKATSDWARWLVVGWTSKLEDVTMPTICDYADNIALLSHIQKDNQEKTTRVDEIGSSVGLKIHADKTQIMKEKNKSTQKIDVRGTALEEAEHFK